MQTINMGRIKRNLVKLVLGVALASGYAGIEARAGDPFQLLSDSMMLQFYKTGNADALVGAQIFQRRANEDREQYNEDKMKELLGKQRQELIQELTRRGLIKDSSEFPAFLDRLQAQKALEEAAKKRAEEERSKTYLNQWHNAPIYTNKLNYKRNWPVGLAFESTGPGYAYHLIDGKQRVRVPITKDYLKGLLKADLVRNNDIGLILDGRNGLARNEELCALESEAHDECVKEGLYKRNWLKELAGCCFGFR